jgi:hypothetical protein
VRNVWQADGVCYPLAGGPAVRVRERHLSKRLGDHR